MYDRKAADSGCSTNTNTALSEKLPVGLPTGIRPHQMTAPSPGRHVVTRMPHLYDHSPGHGPAPNRASLRRMRRTQVPTAAPHKQNRKKISLVNRSSSLGLKAANREAPYVYVHTDTEYMARVSQQKSHHMSLMMTAAP